MIAGQSLTISNSAFSYLVKGKYQHQNVISGKVNIELALTWSDPLAFDHAVPLTGEFYIVPKDHPLAGKRLCITSGWFGARRSGTGAQILFWITGARDSTCSGADVPIDVRNCVYRDDTTELP